MNHASLTPEPNSCDVAILAGGFGTRLARVNGNLPKVLSDIGGRSVIEHQIASCRESGFVEILILVSHLSNAIVKYLGDGSKFGVNIKYLHDDPPMGTGPALFKALKYMKSNFLLLNGDIYFDINLKNFFNFHILNGGTVSLLVHPNNHPHDSDVVVVDKHNKVSDILAYPHSPSLIFQNVVSAGLYSINKGIINDFSQKSTNFDFVKVVLPELIKKGCDLFAYRTVEYAKDMGTPERLEAVRRDIVAKLPERLGQNSKRRAVFVDRDGTIIENIPHLNDVNDLKLIPGASEALKLLNANGILAILTTNQPVVARGDLSFEGLELIHAKLDMLLGSEGAYLDAKFFCPHHPDTGFQGEISDLKFECSCRKPNIGMMLEAINRFNIDVKKSWVVGDTTTDLEFGSRGGVRSILVETGIGGQDELFDCRPEYCATNLLDAVKIILDD